MATVENTKTEKSEVDAKLARKVAALSPNQRLERLTEIADARDTSDEGILEFTKLLFGPEATVSG